MRASDPLSAETDRPDDGDWIGDEATMIYFRADCEAGKAVPAERQLRIGRERSLELLGFSRSNEPGC